MANSRGGEQKLDNISLIEKFIDEVLNSTFADETKTDILKVMNCFIYIRDNIGYIHWAVDNKNDPSIYKYQDNLKTGRVGDHKKRVLRDPDDTAFHINGYTSGQQAQDTLLGLIAQVEMYLKELSEKQRLIFAQKLKFDGDVGCLEARIGAALIWAAQTLSSSLRQLDEIMQSCRDLYSQEAEQKEPFSKFAERYCKENNITTCVQDNQNKEITFSILQKYAEMLGFEETEEKVGAEEKNNQSNESMRLPIPDYICMDKQVINFHFNNKSLANQFAKEVIKITGTKEKTRFFKKVNNIEIYIIQLNKDDVNTFFGKGIDYFLLLNNGLITPGEYENNVKFLTNFLRVPLLQQFLLLQHSDNGVCVLQKMAREIDSAAFYDLIQKIDPEICKKAAFLQDKTGFTLTTIAQHQNSEAFKKYITKLDDATCLKGAQLKGNYYLLSWVAQKQSSSGFSMFLEKAHRALEGSGKMSFDDFPKLIELYTNMISFQSGRNILNFLNLLDTRTQEALAQHFKDNIQDYNNRLLLMALHDKIGNELRQESKEENSIVLPNIIEFSSNLLLAYRMQHPPKPFLHSEEKPSLEEVGVLRLFNEGKAGIKIIEDKNLSTFTKQLADYTRREPLRIRDKEKEGYKYVHLTGEIIRARSNEEGKGRKKYKIYTHTKKTSFTLVSKYLHTGLFGLNNSSQEMVGVVCSVDKVKAMFSRNNSTYNRRWYNKRGLVGQYANSIQGISYTDMNEFKSCIDSQPGAMNEILLSISHNHPKNKVVAIVIGRDTPKAREIARQRQKKYLGQFKIDLPIVFYDPEHRRVGIYSKMEQILDTIQQAVLQKRGSLHSYFSSQVSIKINDIETTLNKEEQTAILNTLTNLSNGAMSLQETWDRVNAICKHSTPANKVLNKP